jgi:transcription antitermination factor NusG
MTPGVQWFALVVPHQHERRTGQSLEWQGWETLTPQYRSRRQWSDRIKEVELPLFGGYVLCRFSLAERMRVEDTPGVSRIVGFGGGPMALADAEIAAIRCMLDSRLPLLPWPFLKAGDRVRLERGPLKGMEGVLIQIKDSFQLVVGVELLQRSIAVQVDPATVVPLRARSAIHG